MRLALLLGALFPLAAGANPTGGTVTSGSATISSSGSTVTVNTGSGGTIINWTSFSIANGETTRINQPSPASVTLNRVTGPTSSSLNGSLQSNGQVFLTNPNGIVIGSSAQINVAGFVASSLDIADADFLAGNLRFNGTGGPVVNNGTIVAADYVALIGAEITLGTTSTISAGPGGVVLAAGSPVAITSSAGVFTSVSIGNNTPGAAIHFEGVISSTGPLIAQTGGGSSLPHQNQLPTPPVLNPGTLTINPNTTNTTINWTQFNIGTGAGSIGSGNVGNLTAANSGRVSIQGSLASTGAGPAVVGLALNLEKREASF